MNVFMQQTLVIELYRIEPHRSLIKPNRTESFQTKMYQTDVMQNSKDVLLCGTHSQIKTENCIFGCTTLSENQESKQNPGLGDNSFHFLVMRFLACDKIKSVFKTGWWRLLLSGVWWNLSLVVACACFCCKPTCTGNVIV